jgi:hypothetical protein
VVVKENDLALTQGKDLKWVNVSNENIGSLTVDQTFIKLVHNKQGLIQILGGSIEISGLSNSIWIQNGGVGIGIDEPEHSLHVDGDVGITGEFYALSDRRHKKNINSLTSNLEAIMALNPVSFNWKEAPAAESASIGLIAQEVELLFPELVHTSVDGTKMVNYQALGVLSIQAIKEQQDEISSLAEQVSLLSLELKKMVARYPKP